MRIPLGAGAWLDYDAATAGSVLGMRAVRAFLSNPTVSTRDVLRRVQEERVCWLGGTRWHGMDAMRISVSNWSTTDEDVDRSADSILRAVRA